MNNLTRTLTSFLLMPLCSFAQAQLPIDQIATAIRNQSC